MEQFDRLLSMQAHQGIDMVAARRRPILGRTWTRSEDEVLRAKWGKVKTYLVAAELKRSPSALKQRARKLDLQCERGYTMEQLQMMKERWLSTPTNELAKLLGRTVVAIYRLAHVMRLPRKSAPLHSTKVIEQVRRLHAKKLSDFAIADRLGLTRDQAYHIRAGRLKLPAIDDPEIVRERQLRAVKTQYARLGIRNGGDLRALAYRRFATRNGWPEDLPPRAVQILNVLAEQGPKTGRELAEAIGTKLDEKNCVTGYARYLKCSSHSALIQGHGTYTGFLMSRGLVFHQRRSKGAGSGRGGGRLPGLYILTPAAITMREACLEQQRTRGAAAGTEAGVHATQAR